MKFFTTIFASSLAVASVLAQSLTINTPVSLVSGQPTLISWSGGVPPFFLSVEPANQPGAPPLEDLGEQDGTSFTWNVDLAAGTAVGFLLRDSTGATAQSAGVVIQ
ncbi:hypothetical protein K435DRAFT_777457 [Dendrothele bispora CBS 962.96]|uniref:Ser-Thr-rich glycosyl-phosphatidyl-inositol-anchored membrane family-domain-containing protein n=1 Tax=Dendrothele bispora (strain CBS 962.96) TaxID=1314807 RepID=A0A4S8M8N3_DENBC|nr:hypothetical protein K435DRAFT_777457 [Dendrothele bispora CBS 962.96]